mmetsp:Transcript_22837/g.53830  ORF Transcript_22837/g.53830 Transcript_22837/m.53830 type:complete len:255 (+) Transcript_22837:550-1314(+)
MTVQKRLDHGSFRHFTIRAGEHLERCLVIGVHVFFVLSLQDSISLLESCMELIGGNQLCLLLCQVLRVVQVLILGLRIHALHHCHLRTVQLRHQLPEGLPESDKVGEENDALIISQSATIVLVVVLERLLDHGRQLIIDPFLGSLLDFFHHGPQVPQDPEAHFHGNCLVRTFRAVIKVLLHLQHLLLYLQHLGIHVLEVALENVQGKEEVLLQMWGTAKPLDHFLIVDLAIHVQIGLLQHHVQIYLCRGAPQGA